MKKYTVIVDEDYQAFNENCNITLDEIDLKIQVLNKELEDIKNIALKNHEVSHLRFASWFLISSISKISCYFIKPLFLYTQYFA